MEPRQGQGQVAQAFQPLTSMLTASGPRRETQARHPCRRVKGQVAQAFQPVTGAPDAIATEPAPGLRQPGRQSPAHRHRRATLIPGVGMGMPKDGCQPTHPGPAHTAASLVADRIAGSRSPADVHVYLGLPAGGVIFPGHYWPATSNQVHFL